MYREDSRDSIVVIFLQTWLRGLVHAEDGRRGGGGRERKGEGFIHDMPYCEAAY